MGFVLFILSILLFGFLGLLTWASSDIPIMFREISFNTRKEESSGPDYKLVKLLSILMKISAVILWVIGLVVAIGGLVGARSLERLF